MENKMSIINFLVKNLPNALEKALGTEIPSDKQAKFKQTLINDLEHDKWSIWHPVRDFDQIKTAMEDASKAAGITWSSIEHVAIDAGESVIKAAIKNVF